MTRSAIQVRVSRQNSGPDGRFLLQELEGYRIDGITFEEVPRADSSREPSPVKRSFWTPEVLISLSSAGLFSAMYGCLKAYLEKDRHRELLVKRGDLEITIRAHDMPSEKKLLASLGISSQDSDSLRGIASKTAEPSLGDGAAPPLRGSTAR